MSPTINCPYCQLPQAVPDEFAAGGEVYCSNCGVPLPSPTLRPPTVLWIDDDPLLLGLCVTVLEQHGYRVLTAADGPQGIAFAHAERPDVILLDVLMPTMSGFEVCAHLRGDPHLQDTPIILLTALQDPSVRPRGGEGRRDHHAAQAVEPRRHRRLAGQSAGPEARPPPRVSEAPPPWRAAD